MHVSHLIITINKAKTLRQSVLQWGPGQEVSRWQTGCDVSAQVHATLCSPSAPNNDSQEAPATQQSVSNRSKQVKDLSPLQINLSQIYAYHLALFDHTQLIGTQHRWTCPTLTPGRSQAGTWFTYPTRMAGWVDLGSWLNAEIIYLFCRQSYIHFKPLNLKSDAPPLCHQAILTLNLRNCVNYSHHISYAITIISKVPS